MSDPINHVEELAHLLRLQKYHKRKRRALQYQVEKLKVVCEVQRRASQDYHGSQRILADCIRTGNGSDFRAAFDAIHRVYQLGNLAEAYPGDSTVPETSQTGSFFDDISRASKTRVLGFISDLISDPEVLVARLLELDQAQLESLSSDRASHPTSQSVLGLSPMSHHGRISSPRYSARGTAPASFPDLGRQSVLSLLLGLVSSRPAPPRASSAVQQDGFWASVCARLLSERRPGREQVVSKILDKISYDTKPTVNKALEAWMIESIRDGQFLLSRSAASSFQLRNQSTGPVAGDSHPDRFYHRAIGKLFALIKDNHRTHIVPHAVISLCQRTIDALRRMDNQESRNAPFFFLSHWLFATFLPENVITPESRGMLLETYFPETARHRILREVVMRAQRTVFDHAYLWNHTHSTESPMQAEINAMATIFRPEKPASFLRTDVSTSSPDFVLRSISSYDVRALVKALYPAHPIVSPKSTADSPVKSPISSASSASGLSFFRGSIIDDDQLPEIPGKGSDMSFDSNVSSVDPLSPSRSEIGGVADEIPSISYSASLKEVIDEIGKAIQEKAEYGSSLSRYHWILLEIRHNRVDTFSSKDHASDKMQDNQDRDEYDSENDYRQTDEDNDIYVSLRRSIFELLSDPRFLDARSRLSHVRSSDLQAPFPLSSRSTNPFTQNRHKDSKNPYRSRASSGSASVVASSEDADLCGPSMVGQEGDELPPSLSGLLDLAIERFERSEQFTKVLHYTETLGLLDEISSYTHSAKTSLLCYFIRDLERSIRRSRESITRLEATATLLDETRTQTDAALKQVLHIANKTRVKMWYCTDVRPAASYVELERLAGAIRDLALPRQALPKRSEPPPLRHKGTLRPKNLSAIKKGEAGIVDVMITDPAYRLENKLRDDQVTITETWMEMAGVDKICPGEERLHRLLCEISKCCNQLISPDPVVSPVLWSSDLFQQDRVDGEAEALMSVLEGNRSREGVAYLSRPSSSGSELLQQDWQVAARRTPDFNYSLAATSVGSRSSPGEIDRTGTLLTRSSTTLWSPSGYRSLSPLSNASPPSRAWSPSFLRQSISKESFSSTSKIQSLMHDLRQSTLSLLTSDIIQSTFPSGSETDIAFFHGTEQDVIVRLDAKSISLSPRAKSKTRSTNNEQNDQKRDSKILPGPSHGLPESLAGGRVKSAETSLGAERSSGSGTRIRKPFFDLDGAKRRLVHRFNLCSGPHEKLKILHDIDELLLTASVSASGATAPRRGQKGRHTSSHAPPTKGGSSISSLRLTSDTRSHHAGELKPSIDNFCNLFTDSSTRPACLFRDLQTIASLLPSQTLDNTPAGKSFWAATAAAMSIKQQLTQAMVETADKIISQHTTDRKTAPLNPLNPASLPTAAALPASITHPPLLLNPPQQEEAHPLIKVGSFLRIAAAQGHPVAQRELATLYLTYPDLLPRTLAPFAKTRDVFKATGTTRMSRLPGEGREKRLDPETMCVAVHWMELSAKGGDALAKAFLDGKG